MTTRDQFDTLAPEFRIRVNGQDAPANLAADLIGASVFDDVDAAGMCALTLYGWDGVKMEPKWIDDDLFKIGNPIEILIGYQPDLTSLFKGEITGLEPLFHEGEPPRLIVRGHDKRHRLMRRRRTRTFTNVKDSEVADQIASDAGLGADVQATSAKMPYVIQHNQTDHEFLLERAGRIGYEVLIDDRTLRFRKRGNDGKETLTLRRDVELLEYLARLSTVGQTDEVMVRGWDPKDKKELVGHSKSSENPASMGGTTSGPGVVKDRFGEGTVVAVQTPVMTQEHADQIAKGMYAEMALRFVQADCVCIGEPRIRAGSVVKIDGVGTRFSGAYYVTACEHRYALKRGYRTSFTARRNAT